MNKNRRKIASLAFVAILLITSSAMILKGSTGAYDETETHAITSDPYSYDESALWAEYENLMATIDPAILEQWTADPAFAGITPTVVPIGIWVALMAVSFFFGMYVGANLGNPGSGGSQEEVNAVLRQLEAEKIQWFGDGVITMATSILPMTTNMWGFTQEHWNRAVELAVSDSWAFGNAYDPNFILEQSQMRPNLEAVLYNWQASLDNPFNSIVTQVNTYNSFPYLQAVTTNLVWDTGSAELRNSVFDFSQLVTNATFGQTVYIDSSTDVSGGVYNQLTSGTLYNLTNANVVLRDVWTGSNTTSGLTVTITPGANNLSTTTYNGTSTTIKSGLYRIETPGATIAGPLSRSADDNAADVYGTLIHKSNVLRWFTWSDNTTYMNSVGNAAVATNNLSLQIGYIDRAGSNATSIVDVVGVKPGTGQYINLIRDWENQIDRMNITVDIAARSGEVIWTIFDICETSIPFLSPSAIVTYIPGLTLNAQQVAMIAVQQMVQIARAYELYGDRLQDGLAINFSPESLDLYIRGDIYMNDILIYSDIVFTPFSLLVEHTFTANEPTVWSNAGFIQIWGTSDDISGWGGPTGSTYYGLLPLGNGYTIEVKQIGRSGALIDTVTLTPEQIRKYTTEPGKPPGPSIPPIISDSTDYIAILFIVFGALITLIGIFTRSSTVLILGMAILGIGALLYFVIPAIVGWFNGWFPFNIGSGVTK